MTGVAWVTADKGGLNRYVSATHIALRELGVDVTTVLLHPQPDVPGVHTTAHSRNLIGRLARLWWRTQRLPRADVLVSHFAAHGILPATIGRHRRAVLIVHFHGPWSAESRAMGQGRLAVRAKHALESLLYRRAAVLVVLSDAFKDLLVSQYGVPPDRVRVIPPGVDADWFVPVSAFDRAQLKLGLGLEADHPVVLTVRRLVPRMGIEVLLQAWTDLRLEGGTLLVAGTGPDRARLEALSVGRPGIRFLGEVSEDALREVYRAADLVVMPSTALEGYGLVVLEALACGTPVVASRLGGISALLPRLAPDLLVPPGDVESLATAMGSALARSDALRTPARKLAEEHTWRATARDLQRLYEAYPSGPRSSASRPC